jgi:hypothetical protein
LKWPSYPQPDTTEQHVIACTLIMGHDGDHCYQWGDSRVSWEQSPVWGPDSPGYDEMGQ